ncbi:hypothetical protein ACB092_10G008800 [Castanea dentata]
MTLFLPHTFHPNHLTHSSSPFHVKCSFKFRAKAPTITTTIPARDRVIDFGKHKGKMLGALPSSYLKWVSKNLRARDFEEWAKLADQVLQDPVYNDRIEWEFAENLLNGNSFNVSLSRNYESSVSELLEISERFGWDNNDKLGWSKVSFELLGTSKGGRIPRVSKNSGKERGLDVEKKVEVLSKGEEKRKERRVRLRMKKREVGIKEESKDGFGNKVYGNAGCRNDVIRFQRDTKNGQEQKMEFYNPFPGREALLKKVLNHKRPS